MSIRTPVRLAVFLLAGVGMLVAAALVGVEVRKSWLYAMGQSAEAEGREDQDGQVAGLAEEANQGWHGASCKGCLWIDQCTAWAFALLRWSRVADTQGNRGGDLCYLVVSQVAKLPLEAIGGQ